MSGVLGASGEVLGSRAGGARAAGGRVARVGALIVLLAGCWSCGAGGQEEPLPLAEAGGAAVDTTGVRAAQWPGFPLLPDDRFPISAWCAPPNRETTAERYREYAGAGFTVALPALEDPYLEEPNRKRLETAAAEGLFAILRDDRVHPDEATRAGWGARLDSVVEAYAGQPGLLGYFLADEPAPDVYPSLGALTRRLAARDSVHPGYVNMMGLSPAGTGHYGLAYNRYLGSFLEGVSPDLFSIDLYSLTTEGDSPNLCPGLDTTRILAARHGIPFWAVLLLTPHLGYREPTTAELAWQAHLALAYGAKGIVWFTYWTPRPDESNYHLGPISYEGERTPAYDRVAEVNRSVQALGSQLAAYEPWAVLHTGTLPRDGRPLPADFHLGDHPVRIDTPGNLTVSIFLQSRGLLPEPTDFRVMIVNRDYRQPAPCTLSIPGWRLRRIGDAERTGGAGDRTSDSIEISPGGAVLYSVVPAG